MDPSGNSPHSSAKKRRKNGTTPEIEVGSPEWLPKGWKTYEKIREKGVTAGTKDKESFFAFYKSFMATVLELLKCFTINTYTSNNSYEKYYFDPDTRHRFRSKPEVTAYFKTGEIPKHKAKPKQRQSGNNEFHYVTLHSELQAVTLKSADPKNNGINFNQERERDKEQKQPFNPHLKNVNTIEFLKADDLECTMKRSNDDFVRKRFLLELDLNKIPDDTNFPYHSAPDAEEHDYSLQNPVKVGVADTVVVRADEEKSRPLLKNALVSNTFLGYATPKPEASLVPMKGQTNDHWFGQPMQNININIGTQPSHYAMPMAKSLLNTGFTSSAPAQQKVIPIHNPASPCSVLPVEKQSDKKKKTANIKRKSNNRRKTNGDFSKITGKEFKRYLAELGRKLCIKVCQQDQSAAETLGPLIISMS